MVFSTRIYQISLAFLASTAHLLAQSPYTNEIKLDQTQSNQYVSVDSLPVDVFLTGMTAGKTAKVIIKESAGSSPHTETLPIDLFGKRAIFPTAGTTEAVRVTLTKDGYGVGAAKDPASNTNGNQSSLLQPRPWRLPVEITIDYDNKLFTLKIFKSYPYTGSILLDAARIDSLITDNNPDLYKLLRRYDSKMPDPNSSTKAAIKGYFETDETITLKRQTGTAAKPDSITKKVKHNPYLADLIQALPGGFPEPNGGTITKTLVAGAAGATRAPLSLGALSNPMLAADALATFIARRFKEEVNVAFLNEFRTKLKIDTTLGIVFPQTKSTMLAVDPYQYTTFMESMKTAFEEDLKLLPSHSAQLLDTLVARKKIKFGPDRLVVSRVTLQTLQRTLDNRNDYWGAFRAIGPSSLQGSSDALTSVLLTGSVLLNSVLDTTDKVQLPDFAAAHNKAYTDRVIGLLLARYDTTLLPVQTKIDTSKALDEKNFLAYALHTKTGSYTSLTAAASALGTSLQAFDNTLKAIREQKKKQQDKEDSPGAFGATIVIVGDKATKNAKRIAYTDFANKLVNAFDRMLSAENIFKDLPALQIRQRVLKPVQDGIMAFKHVQQEEYALAIIYTANLLVALTSRNDTADSRTTAALKKYGTFMTSVVAAETRDQMLTALETAALPVGSYRIKRNNFFSVAINSYGGIATGYENVRAISTVVSGSATPGTFKSGFLLAPYAPVGISFAWGRNADYIDRKDHGSFGIHANLLDVGALAAVRIGNETADLPEFTWQNLLAPGLQLMWGIPKTVWTVSGGVQLGPELRRINLDQGKNVIDTKQWRIGVTFSADIPIFNVFTQANQRNIKTLRKSTLQIAAGKDGIDNDAPFVTTDDKIAKLKKKVEKRKRRAEETANDLKKAEKAQAAPIK